MRVVSSYRKALLLAIGIVCIFLLLRSTRPSSSVSSTSVTSQNHDRERKPLPSDQEQGQEQKSFPTIIPEPSVAEQPAQPQHPVKGPQRPLTELSDKPLRAQLSYYFPYKPWTRFPGYIWQTWREGPSSASFPEDWRAYEASWTELHPGFIHEVISDSAAVDMLAHLYSAIPDVVEAYISLPKPVLKADFFRYLILLARGGIYSDMDTIALRSAVSWVPSEIPRESYGLVVGIEADPDRPDWADWYSRRIQFCQWTIQSKPGHPVLREIVARITEETLARKSDGTVDSFDVSRVVDLTGPAIWTDTVFDYFNEGSYVRGQNNAGPAAVTTEEHIVEAEEQGTGVATQTAGNITWEAFTGMQSQKMVKDVMVLPITCFSPGVGQMGAGEDDDEMAMVKHLFEGSWKPESERHIGGDAPIIYHH